MNTDSKRFTWSDIAGARQNISASMAASQHDICLLAGVDNVCVRWSLNVPGGGSGGGEGGGGAYTRTDHVNTQSPGTP